ncbi:hypothetical protein [Massilia varians]|uniref:hypothetical protein n=1 Tax=Massilia varians TaxID=457921 RepID=UPI00249374E2|nr:hypothetical protein [Massilia varians]
MPSRPKDTIPWSDDELGAAIKAYLSMLHKELAGIAYNKAAVNRDLRADALAARTEGSVEFRMQNISAALYELKMPYIVGYKPARNIGSDVKEKMSALLSAYGVESLEPYVPTADINSRACQYFCVERGHEIISKGLFHDRSDDHQKAQETESRIPIPGRADRPVARPGREQGRRIDPR